MGELKKHQPSMTIDEQVENLKAASRIKIKSMFSGFWGDKNTFGLDRL